MHSIDTHFSARHLLGFRATVEKKTDEFPAFTWLILVRKKNMKSFQSGNARREAERPLPYQKAFPKWWEGRFRYYRQPQAQHVKVSETRGPCEDLEV